MATLTIADLDNGKRDLQTVDEVANSRAATATTRFGQQTTTLYEAIRRINATGDEILSNLGFRVPVPYASGLNVTDSRFTVTGPDGKVYAPLSAPFTAGAWDPTQWYVLQNDLNDHKLLVFDTLPAAQAAATTLPDGQVVDALDVQNRYIAQDGTLEIVGPIMAYKQPYPTAKTRPVVKRFQDWLFMSEWEGAGIPGYNMDAAFSEALGSGKRIFVPDGTYDISVPLPFKRLTDFNGRGTILDGAGRRRTLIRNITNANRLVDFGDVASDQDGIDCSLLNLSLQGNPLTTGGIAILGDDDDLLTQASRSARVDNVRISDVGSGPALRLSAWAFNGGFIEGQNNYRMLEIGNHVYASKIDQLYSISSTNEAIYIADTVNGSKSSVIDIGLAVVQGSGTSGQAVYLGGAAGVTLRKIYCENLNAGATAMIRIGANCRSARIEDAFYTRGSGPTTVDVIDSASPSAIIDNVDVRGDVRSVVKLTGSANTRIGSLEQPSGSRSVGWIDDQTTNKTTSYENPKQPGEQRSTANRIIGDTSSALLSFINRTSGAVTGFFQNGRWHFGTDTTSVNLQGAGSTLSALSGVSGNYATFRAEAFRLGSTNAKWVYYTSSPEGAITADPGSLCSVVSGGAAGLWFKTANTDATGWVKLT